MIQLPANANILVMHDAVSFRNGIDGTAAIASVVLQKNPMDGAFFVFRSKMGHGLRILFYDGKWFIKGGGKISHQKLKLFFDIP